jgi:hypothetical protein
LTNTENARLAIAVRGMAAEAGEPSLAARVHALAALLDQADFTPPEADTDCAATELELDAALAAGEEERVIGLARLLGAEERRRFVGVDWSAVSRG